MTRAPCAAGRSAAGSGEGAGTRSPHRPAPRPAPLSGPRRLPVVPLLRRPRACRVLAASCPRADRCPCAGRTVPRAPRGNRSPPTRCSPNTCSNDTRTSLVCRWPVVHTRQRLSNIRSSRRPRTQREQRRRHARAGGAGSYGVRTRRGAAAGPVGGPVDARRRGSAARPGPRPVRPARALVLVRPVEVPRPVRRPLPGCGAVDRPGGSWGRDVVAARRRSAGAGAPRRSPGRERSRLWRAVSRIAVVAASAAVVGRPRPARRVAEPARSPRRRPPRWSSPPRPVRRCGTSPPGSPPGDRGPRWRPSPSGSSSRTRSLGAAGARSGAAGGGWADAVRTPATKRRAARPTIRATRRPRPLRLCLPLHVVVTSLLFAQCVGSLVRAGRGCRALPVLPARRQPGHRLPRGRTTARPSAAVVLRRSAAAGSPPSRRRCSPSSSAAASPSRSAATRWSAASGGPARGGPSTRTRSRSSPSGSRRPSAPAGAAEIPSHEVGLAILGPLRELDEVAYLRFAQRLPLVLLASRTSRRRSPSSRPPRRPTPLRARADPVPGTRAVTAAADPCHRAPSRRSQRADTSTAELRPARQTPTAARRPRVEPQGEGEHDRDRRTRADRPRDADGRPVRTGERRGLTVERVYTTARRAPVRRGHLGAPRRRDDELARRLGQLRAARRRVPASSGRSTPPTSSPASTSAALSARRSASRSLRQLIDRVVARLPPRRPASTATSPRRTTPRSSPTS